MWKEKVPGMSLISFNEKYVKANQQNKTTVVDFRHLHDKSHQQQISMTDSIKSYKPTSAA